MTPAVTERREVEARFRPLKQAGEAVSVYRIDQIDAAITYGAGERVVSIRMPPALDMSGDELTQRFGQPDRIRPLSGGAQALDYDGAGLSIEYSERVGPPAAVDFHAPAKVPSRDELSLFDAAVPVRPPLADIGASTKRVEAALSSTSEGFSWVSIEREQGQAAQLGAELEKRGLLMTAPDFRDMRTD